jgi:hypothetical protein
MEIIFTHNPVLQRTLQRKLSTSCRPDSERPSLVYQLLVSLAHHTAVLPELRGGRHYDDMAGILAQVRVLRTSP